MTKRYIKKHYLMDSISMEEAIALLMEFADMFRGEAMGYLMK